MSGKIKTRKTHPIFHFPFLGTELNSLPPSKATVEKLGHTGSSDGKLVVDCSLEGLVEVEVAVEVDVLVCVCVCLVWVSSSAANYLTAQANSRTKAAVSEWLEAITDDESIEDTVKGPLRKIVAVLMKDGAKCATKHIGTEIVIEVWLRFRPCLLAWFLGGISAAFGP